MSGSVRSGTRRFLTRSLALHGHAARLQPATRGTATRDYGGCCISCYSATAARQPRQLISSATGYEWRGVGDKKLSRVRRMHFPVRARGMASYSDPYATLGLQRSASQAEVDKAYRKLAMKWHPDRNQDNKEAAEKQFKMISEAYQSISSGSASSPFGAGSSSGGSPGGFPGGFPGGPGSSHAHVDPRMEAFLREMMKGPQLSEQQIRQMMAEAARRQGSTRRSTGPGFQSVHYEFSFGGRPKAREPTQAEKEAMEVSCANDSIDLPWPRGTCFLCRTPLRAVHHA